MQPFRIDLILGGFSCWCWQPPQKRSHPDPSPHGGKTTLAQLSKHQNALVFGSPTLSVHE